MELRIVAQTRFGFNFFLVGSIRSAVSNQCKGLGVRVDRSSPACLPGSLKDWQDTQRCGGWVEGSGCSERVKKYLPEIDVNQ